MIDEWMKKTETQLYHFQMLFGVICIPVVRMVCAVGEAEK